MSQDFDRNHMDKVVETLGDLINAFVSCSTSQEFVDVELSPSLSYAICNVDYHLFICMARAACQHVLGEQNALCPIGSETSKQVLTLEVSGEEGPEDFREDLYVRHIIASLAGDSDTILEISSQKLAEYEQLPSGSPNFERELAVSDDLFAWAAVFAFTDFHFLSVPSTSMN